MSRRKVHSGKQDEPQAKGAILRAGLKEFATEGFAGARTESIARSAKVNVALLFYYFKSKQELHGAVLEQMFAEWRAVVNEALVRPGTPREKLMAYVGAYFDFVSSNPLRPRLVQQEMMRQGRSGSPHIRKLAQKYIRPVHRNVMAVIKKGMASGEFKQFEARHFVYSITGIVSFYFANSPVIRALSGQDPWSARNVKARRKEVLRIIKSALFV